ncbi:hypothetical protein XA68_13613 [Ophiocordyceps unilateralis]|uniref:GAR domain-containing protein n=1 Tax=Ophiocordyceps unilateralis TaxID=268505 RepID=A0A2A9PAE3_OPHUN|nr:hypothetical protein XA68_13613 [Ophiocordyceps unilateralis]
MADHPPVRFRPHHAKRLSLFAANRDDLLVRLAPATAVEALAEPTGTLSACLDAAPSSDRDLAVRAAIFSRRVWEWLAELQGWNWPSRLDHGFVAGLSATDAAQYAIRIHDIDREMDRLDVEDIKKHVLATHVLSLSRPTTPATDSDRRSSVSLSSTSSYNRMDDFTAVVTTIVMQALPNLARLTALLRLWTLRLRVLRQVPLFMSALEDVEAGLASAWAAMASSAAQGAHYERQAWEATNRSLASGVAEPARLLDYMLDCLEGMPDTLPDSWIDRVEAVERDYVEWAVVSEHTLAAAQTKHFLGDLPGGAAADDSGIASPGPLEPSWPTDGLSEDMDTECAGSCKTDDDSLAPPPDEEEQPRCHDEDQTRTPSPQSRVPTPIGQGEATPDRRSGSLSADDDSPLSGHVMTPIEEDDDDDEAGLPPLRTSASRQSLNSQASTLIFSGLGPFSSPPEMSTSPVVPAARLRQEADSPLHHSPLRRAKTEASGSELASMTRQADDDVLFLKSPADQSFADDFDDTMSMTDGTSYTLTSDGAGDQQLQQQISDIIGSIPAKIKLASSPPMLNPPDLQLPRLKKAESRESGLRRSASNLSTVSSSRAGTPSFTLSPAKHCRPRHRRSHQEIKVYHLSRSTGEPPIKLFIRCVGEHGERVMVRVGGGWADLSEYLKAYASHHGRRSNGKVDAAKVEVRAGATPTPLLNSSPTTRPGSAADEVTSPATPLQIRKMRASAEPSSYPRRPRPWTPSSSTAIPHEPSSSDSLRSRSSSRISWLDDEDSSSFLGLAGPSGRKVEMTDENRAWVESVKEKVRIASGSAVLLPASQSGRFGDLGSVGGTRRLFPNGRRL